MYPHFILTIMNHYYYTYVLLSLKDGMFYTGYTRDVQERFKWHSNGWVDCTMHRRPLLLIYFEACLSQKDALARERYLKSGMGKRYIRNRLKVYLANCSISAAGLYNEDTERLKF